jgi:hypothetical protein
MPWLLCLLLSTCEVYAASIPEQRILIDATPKVQTAQPGDMVTQRWIVAPDYAKRGKCARICNRDSEGLGTLRQPD